MLMISFLEGLSAPVLAIFVTLGIVLFWAVYFLSFYIIDCTRRKYVFHRLSKEYGLRVETQKYSLNSTVVPFKFYPFLRMVGTYKGHAVCIEDLRSFPFGGTRGFVFSFSKVGHGASYMKLQTEMTLDGLKHTIYHDSIIPVTDSRASYKEIKAELDQII